jgi:hypothetical protein
MARSAIASTDSRAGVRTSSTNACALSESAAIASDAALGQSAPSSSSNSARGIACHQ